MGFSPSSNRLIEQPYRLRWRAGEKQGACQSRWQSWTRSPQGDAAHVVAPETVKGCWHQQDRADWSADQSALSHDRFSWLSASDDPGTISTALTEPAWPARS